MGAVIAYDKPIADFIDALSATGHVTHTAYRKTSVTLHHNGGRLSLQGILDVWKTRPASAHFQVDGQGALGQYVKVNEYAWATGNTEGNKSSISIELANATMAPNYLVSEVTMMEGARLAGWHFARVIGVAPTRDNFHVHHDWKSTLCAGPCIDANYNRLLEQAQVAYLYFVGQGGAASPSPATPSPSTPAPGWGGGKTIEQVAREVMAGSWGNGQDRQNRLRNAGYDPALVQATVNAIVYGKPIPAAPAPAAPSRKSVDEIAAEVIAGDWGNNPQRSERLQNAGYNPSEVQAAVNRKLGGRGGGAVRLSISALAQQVIAGQWSKGAERRRRLTAAGYNYDAVQAEVNRRLRG